jgi:hypothetical protein
VVDVAQSFTGEPPSLWSVFEQLDRIQQKAPPFQLPP